MPRVALTATNAAGPITSPATSLLIYNTATAGTSPNNVVPGYYYWNGVAWTALSTGTPSANSAWSTTGNTGTSYPTNFLGTKDNNGLHFLTNSLHRFQIDTSGSVAVGLNPVFNAGAARERFLVDAGSTINNQTPTGAFNLIAGRGYLDNYLQLNIQNNSPTANASTDIVASNDAATETTNFIDMGINSSANTTTGAIGGPGTAYLYGTGNDMAIGNGTPNKNLIFFTGGISPSTYTERIRLDASGRVGIGTNAPASDLTLFQSSGTGGTKGFRFAGNSIGAVNSGTGFLMSLGYNASNNKQLWLGDPDYSGNLTGTFVRFGVLNGNVAVFDAVSGDNSVRRYLTLGVGGDPNSGVVFGNDGNPAAPGSMVWTNGNMAIGNGYRANAAPANGLIVQSNVGIGNNAPTEILDITGNLKFSGALMPNNNPGTAGYLLQSAGGGAAPVWVANNPVTTQAWGLTGNTGTAAGTNFIGTTDANDFVTRTNNIERFRVTSAGNVGIGTAAPAQKLDVNGSINAATSVISQGSVFVDAAITNTGALSPGLILGGISSGESISSKRTTGTNQYGIDFYTAGANRMTITNSGNIGIGNNTPTEKLDITGNLKFSGALMPNNNAGTAGNYLQSAGAGAPPVWTNTAPATGWGLTGNAGTTAGTNFIGTTDAVDFVIKTNATEKARVTSAGNVGIGSANFNATNPEKLLVDAGTTSSTNVISGKGTINSFLQLNIQNLSTGLGASSDVVATADNGTDAANYVDMGINGSGNKNGFYFGLANDAYLYNAGGTVGGNFYMGNSTSGKILAFLTGGSAASNERMRIDGTGNVGIGTIAPAQKLDVNGSINASTSIISQGPIVVDAPAANTGTVAPGLLFGSPASGEGISSKRTTGTNQYGLDFYTGSTTRMSVTQTGNIGIGTNTPGYKLTVAGIVAPSADNAYSLGGGTINRWTAVYATNGAIQTSDRRLKTNIANLNYGLKEVLAMQPVSYNWKEKPTTDHKIGLIAQDVRKLVPEVVIGDEVKEKLGMNYAELVPVLINAIKEQQKEINDLKKLVQKIQK